MKQTNAYLGKMLWYLRRPNLYREVVRIAQFKVTESTSSNTKKQAQLWCAHRALSTSDAVARITGSPLSEPVREKFKARFAEARATIDAVKMAAEERDRGIPKAGPANLDLLYWIAEHLQAMKVVETGVAYGWSSLALLLSLTTRANALLVSTDLPFADRDDAYIGCVVPTEFKPQWCLFRGADRETLPKALGAVQTIDMCHYDSDKSYAGRRWAYPRLWQALRAGGCFVSDDVGDNLAFYDFCSSLNVEPIVVQVPKPIEVKYVGIVIKEKV